MAKKMYLLKQGWSFTLLFDTKKDAIDAMDNLEVGKSCKTEYIDNVGSFYKTDENLGEELSVTRVLVYSQEEIDALKPKVEEEI